MSVVPSAVLVGAGPLACGVMGEQLLEAGYALTVVAGSRAESTTLAGRALELQYTGHLRRPWLFGPVEALELSRTVEVAHRIARADVVVVAIESGAPGASAVSPGLVKALARGLSGRRTPVDVLVCDDRVGAAHDLESAVARVGVSEEVRAHGFVDVLVDRLVTRTGRPDAPAGLVAEADGRILADARAFRSAPPALEQLRLVEDLSRHATRRLCVAGAGYAALAHLGRARGHRLLRTAAADPEVSRVATLVVDEGQHAVATWYGDPATISDREPHRLLERYADARLGITVADAGADPLQALSWNGALTAPARLGAANGRATPALATAAGAALCAVDGLGRSVTARSDLLRRRAGLPSGHRFVHRVLEAAARFDRGDSPVEVLVALTASCVRS
jgi:hypothetical protein